MALRLWEGAEMESGGREEEREEEREKRAVDSVAVARACT